MFSAQLLLFCGVQVPKVVVASIASKSRDLTSKMPPADHRSPPRHGHLWGASGAREDVPDKGARAPTNLEGWSLSPSDWKSYIIYISMYIPTFDGSLNQKQLQVQSDPVKPGPLPP